MSCFFFRFVFEFGQADTEIAVLIFNVFFKFFDFFLPMGVIHFNQLQRALNQRIRHRYFIQIHFGFNGVAERNGFFVAQQNGGLEPLVSENIAERNSFSRFVKLAQFDLRVGVVAHGGGRKAVCGGDIGFFRIIVQQHFAAFVQSSGIRHFCANGAGVDIARQHRFGRILQAGLSDGGSALNKKRQREKKYLEHEPISLNNVKGAANSPLSEILS